MKERIFAAITSKKFVCLVIAVVLVVIGKMKDDNLLWIMLVYMGIEVAQKLPFFKEEDK